MSETSIERYENRGEVTTELMRQILSKQAMPRATRVTMKVCGTIIAVCMLFVLIGSIMGADGSLLWYMLPLAAGFVTLNYLTRVVPVRVGLKCYQETVPGGICVFSSTFTENSAICLNETTGGKSIIEYKHFSRLCAVQDVWVIVTKAQQFVPVFPKTLNETEQKSLLELLQTKCPKMKVEL